MNDARGSLTSLWRQIAARSRMRDSSLAIVRGVAIRSAFRRPLESPPGLRPLHPGLVAELPLHLDDAEGLEHVARLHVLEVAHDEAAVEALADLLHVVLLALQRREIPGVEHLAS